MLMIFANFVMLLYKLGKSVVDKIKLACLKSKWKKKHELTAANKYREKQDSMALAFLAAKFA